MCLTTRLRAVTKSLTARIQEIPSFVSTCLFNLSITLVGNHRHRHRQRRGCFSHHFFFQPLATLALFSPSLFSQALATRLSVWVKVCGETCFLQLVHHRGFWVAFAVNSSTKRRANSASSFESFGTTRFIMWCHPYHNIHSPRVKRDAATKPRAGFGECSPRRQGVSASPSVRLCCSLLPW